MPRLAISADTRTTALVVAVAGIFGAVLPIAIFTLDWVYSVPIVITAAFPLVLYLTGNPRLFFLAGMVFTAPLGLALNFWGRQHMGGAHAFSINLCDFFMVPLMVYQARDYLRGWRRDFHFSGVTPWWLALVALGVGSMVFESFRQMATWEVVRMLKCWLLFLVIVNECVRERHFEVVIWALAANAAVNNAVAFAQWFLKRPLGLQPLGEASAESIEGANLGVYVSATEDVFRVTGLVGHANLFAAYLAMLLPIFVGQMFTRYRLAPRLLLGLVCGTGLVCLGLTLSRSGWISFVVSGGMLAVALFAFPELRRSHLGLKIGMLLGTVGVLMAGSGAILRRLTQSDSGAFDFRLEWVGIAWDMVRDHPVFGLGLNSFIYHLPEYAPYSIPKLYEMFGELFPVVHNTYMIVWSEQGTVGLFLFLGLHASILWIGIKNLRYRGLSDKVFLASLAASCGVVAIMVDNLSSFFTKVQPHARVWWMVVALIVAAHYWNIRALALQRRLAAEQASAAPPPAADPAGATPPSPPPRGAVPSAGD